jgi:hypothetical protein
MFGRAAVEVAAGRVRRESRIAFMGADLVPRGHRTSWQLVLRI